MSGPLGRLVGSTVSANVADGFVALAVPLLALRLTSDPLVISLASVAGMLPWLLFGIPAGALLDRVRRTSALLVANLLRAGGLLALALAVGANSLGVVALYAAVVALGVLELVADNAASSLVPMVAGRDHLDRANSWVHSGQLVAQNFVAVPLAAALFAVLAWGPFAVACLAYAAAAVLAAVLRRDGGSSPTTTADPGEAADGPTERFGVLLHHGWQFIRSEDSVRRLILCSAALAGAVSLAQATMMVYLVRELDVPEALVGLLSVGLTVGGLAGMRLSVRLTRRTGRRRAAVTGVLVLVAGLAGAAVAPSGVIAAIALAVMACGAALWNIAAASARQALTPDRMLGRVLGTTSVMLSAAQIIGALAGGLIARADLRAPFLVGAVLSATLIPVLLRTGFGSQQASPTPTTAGKEV